MLHPVGRRQASIKHKQRCIAVRAFNNNRNPGAISKIAHRCDACAVRFMQPTPHCLELPAKPLRPPLAIPLTHMLSTWRRSAAERSSRSHVAGIRLTARRRLLHVALRGAGGC